MRKALHTEEAYADNDVLDDREELSEEPGEMLMEDADDSGEAENTAEDHDPEADPADGHESCDPLKMYLNEIGSTPLLKKSRELEVARQIEDNRELAITALFSLPSVVEKLVQAGKQIQLGKMPLNEIIRLSSDPEQIRDDEKKKFMEAVRQIERLHQMKTPALYRGKLPARVMALRLRFDFVERLFRETEDEMHAFKDGLAGMNARKAAVGRNTFHERTGSTVEAVEEVLRTFSHARGEINEARNILIEGNLRLVVSAARRYAAMGRMSMLDLIQEGNIGLMRAVDLFDHRKGFKFSTYAMCWIKQAITRALSRHSRLIRLPVHTADELTRIVQASRELTNELAEDPSPETIAARVKLPAPKVRGLLEMSRDPLSLHTPVGEDDSEMIDFIEDKSMQSPLAALINTDLRKKVLSAISLLDPKEEKVLRGRFSIDREEQTLEMLANEFGLTRERIRQIETSAIKKLRNHFAAAAV